MEIFSNNQSYNIVVLLSCLFFAGSIVSQEVTVDDLPQEALALKESPAAPSESDALMLVMKVKDMLSAIDLSLENIALDIKNGAIQVARKTRLVKNILQYRKTINQLSFTLSPTHYDPQLLQMALYVIQITLQNLNKAIAKGFKQLRALKIDDAALTTRIKTDIAVEDLKAEIDIQQKILEMVQKTASKTGLTSRNLMARWVDDKIVTPCYKKEVPRRLLNIGLVGLLGFEVLYLTDCFSNIKWIGGSPVLRGGEYVRWWIAQSFNNIAAGVPPAVVPAQTLSAELLFQIHKVAACLVGAQYPILKWVSDETKERWAEDFHRWKEYVTNGIAAWWNRQKGGQYRVDADRLLNKEQVVLSDQLIGNPLFKRIIKLMLAFAKDPESAKRMGTVPEFGMLLVGASRTGKSFAVKVLYNELMKLYKEMNKPPLQFIEIPQGLIRAWGINKIFHYARLCAPCILFIDEIDLIGLTRTASANGQSNNLQEFLTQMSGFESTNPNAPVFVIGATNDPQSIDLALRQRGRFSWIIPFSYPNVAERIEFLTRELIALAVQIESFDLVSIAQKTEGQSFEDLKALIKSALQEARMKNMPLSQKHLERALDREIRHIINDDSMKYSSIEYNIMAANLTGTALAYTMFATGHILSLVTTKPVQVDLSAQQKNSEHRKVEAAKQNNYIQHGNVYCYNEVDRVNIYSHEELENQCKICLAGFIAEEILLGSCGYSYESGNRQKALELATHTVSKGLTKTVPLEKLPADQQQSFTADALKLLESYEEELRELFTKHKEILNVIFDTLKDKKSLSGDQVRMIYEFMNKESVAQKA